MTHPDPQTQAPAGAPLPPDDLARDLVVAGPESAGVPHVAVGGGIYSILLGGAQTDGRLALIEMRVPDGMGPPLHRHDFEETFWVLEGEIEATFRGEARRVPAGHAVHVPANAPHRFRALGGPARLLCLCAPAGQDEFFLATGDRVSSATAPAPALSPEERRARIERAIALQGRFRSEILV